MHAFLDGNKRMAALAALIFLEINGAEALPEPDALACGRCQRDVQRRSYRLDAGPGAPVAQGTEQRTSKSNSRCCTQL